MSVFTNITAKPAADHPVVPAALSGDVLSAMVNLSGRRRYTSQRVILYAVLASLGHEGAVETSRQALQMFREAHAMLVNGKGSLPGIFCEQVRDAYYGSLQGDRQVLAFADLASATLNAIGDEAVQAPSLLDELVRSGTPLLAVLNALTLVYEEQAKRHALQQKRELQNMMGDIKTIAKQARMVAFNAQIVAARAGTVGKEFAVVAGVMSNITGEIDELVHAAMSGACAA